MQRRNFLFSGIAAAVTASASTWQAGEVAHLIPTASHDRILLKASFLKPQPKGVQLRVGRGKRTVAGQMSDTAGQFWQFDVTGLAPGESHTLELVGARGKALCDPWPVRTFPAPDATPRRFRVLIYTCAGGDQRLRNPKGEPRFLPLPVRHRLLERALAFEPDALVANGDHIYWDLRQTGAPPNFAEDVVRSVGRFTRTLPVLGTENEAVLKRVCDQQIGQLYGTRLRSTPSFFLQDDHDYFENDDANERMVTYPPDHFMLQLGRGTRRMFFPEFLPDANRPLGLPGASAPDRPAGVGESFGTLRCGRLAEIALFDCRRFLSLAGKNAWLVPPETEQWLGQRMGDASVAHFALLSSMPPVWSAGKWGDWNADYLDREGRLSDKVVKPFWQPGWAAQHDRLMRALSEQKAHAPLWISGDMHAHGEARLLRAGSLDLSRNPVHCFLSGALGTGDGWPSGGRRTKPYPAQRLEVDQRLEALEENGFLIVDFEPERIVVQTVRWNQGMGVDAIDSLEVFRRVEIGRGKG